MYIWGLNNYGQLGIFTNSSAQTIKYGQDIVKVPTRFLSIDKKIIDI